MPTVTPVRSLPTVQCTRTGCARRNAADRRHDPVGAVVDDRRVELLDGHVALEERREPIQEERFVLHLDTDRSSSRLGAARHGASRRQVDHTRRSPRSRSARRPASSTCTSCPSGTARPSGSVPAPRAAAHVAEVGGPRDQRRALLPPTRVARAGCATSSRPGARHPSHRRRCRPRAGARGSARDSDAVERVDRHEHPAQRDVLLFAQDPARLVVHLVGVPSSWMNVKDSVAARGPRARARRTRPIRATSRSARRRRRRGPPSRPRRRARGRSRRSR